VFQVAKASRAALKWAVCALCGFLLFRTLRGTDLAHTRQLLGACGPWILLGVVPFALAQALDAEAWRLVLARLAPRVRLDALYPVRVALEAMTVSLPGGIVVAESVAPRLLSPLGIPPSATLAAAGARRWLTMRAHSVYVALGAAAGFVVIREHPGTLASLRYGPLVVLGSALLPLGASLAVSMTLSSGSRAEGLHALLSRIPVPALRSWLTRRREAFVATDAGFATLARETRSLLVPTALLVLAWLLESVEAFVLLRLAGARLSLIEVLAFEAGLSVLRAAWFFAPAGLGATDLGYLAVLHALGVADAPAVGAAFLVLKRGRELLWIAMGYVWMALEARGRSLTWASPGRRAALREQPEA
jgi:glycosyltransferase 2 family protein